MSRALSNSLRLGFLSEYFLMRYSPIGALTIMEQTIPSVATPIAAWAAPENLSRCSTAGMKLVSVSVPPIMERVPIRSPRCWCSPKAWAAVSPMSAWSTPSTIARDQNMIEITKPVLMSFQLPIKAIMVRKNWKIRALRSGFKTMTAVLEIFRHAKIIAAGNPPINGTGIERSCKSLISDLIHRPRK